MAFSEEANLRVCDSPQLTAADADAGSNGEVTYRILAGDQGHFVIGSR